MTFPIQAQALNTAAFNADLTSSEGIASDGQFIYLLPHNHTVGKIDPVTFTVVAALDLSLVDPNYKAFLGGFIVGRYIYLLPHFTSTGPFYGTQVVRIDLDNFTTSGVTSLVIAPDANIAFTGVDGFTDGVWGYVAFNTDGLSDQTGTAIVRFGLGSNFISGSVSRIICNSIPGQTNLKSLTFFPTYTCDVVNAYFTAQLVQGAANPRTFSFWLIILPLNNFSFAAATYIRLIGPVVGATTLPKFTGLMIDDGVNLWSPPSMTTDLSLTTSLGVLTIPKATPTAFTFASFPSGQATPTIPQTQYNNGLYDGWHYCYYYDQDVHDSLLQIDTWNPGVLIRTQLADIAPGLYAPGVLNHMVAMGGWTYSAMFANVGQMVRWSGPQPADLLPDAIPLSGRASLGTIAGSF